MPPAWRSCWPAWANWEHFRELDRKVVEELAGRTQTVVATGGGVPVNPANLASLKTHALVVCLWASPEKIWENVRGQTHRPLFNVPDPQARIRSLLAAREWGTLDADLEARERVEALVDPVKQRG